MSKRLELRPGLTFGSLTVRSRGYAGPHGRSQFWCECVCGRGTLVPGSYLLNGHTSSCGCLMKETRKTWGQNKHIHGRSGKPEYTSFSRARDRCRNPNNEVFAYYGGRGIQFRFASFAEFYRYLGERPSGHTLDRYPNNDGHYEPGNVRWATAKQQRSNRRDAAQKGLF